MLSRVVTFLVSILIFSSALASDVELLSGHWNGSTDTPWGPMAIDSTFSRDGTFRVLTATSFAKVLTDGRWEIVTKGMYRQFNDKWQPTHDNAGNRIHMPSSESHTYRIIDRNSVLIDGQTVMTRVGY